MSDTTTDNYLEKTLALLKKVISARNQMQLLNHALGEHPAVTRNTQGFPPPGAPVGWMPPGSGRWQGMHQPQSLSGVHDAFLYQIYLSNLSSIEELVGIVEHLTSELYLETYPLPTDAVSEHIYTDGLKSLGMALTCIIRNYESYTTTDDGSLKVIRDYEKEVVSELKAGA
jgi:hypothetical protein